MLMIIHCTECGKDGPLPFKLKWEHESEQCTKCYHNKTLVKRYYFCSGKCLKKFVNKFAGHNHDWEPKWTVAISIDADEGDRECIMSYNGETDEVKIEEICKICTIRRWREIVGDERKIFKKQIDRMKRI